MVQTKVLFFLLGVAMLLAACSNKQLSQLNDSIVNPNQKTSSPSHDLADYPTALNSWRSTTYGINTSHFPAKLDSNLVYEFTFVPRTLQAGSTLALKINFETEYLATTFFTNATANGFEQEFSSLAKLKETLYCYPASFGFQSDYALNDMCTIRLLNAIWCGGQDDRAVGGIDSGISIDRQENTVVCWVIDKEL